MTNVSISSVNASEIKPPKTEIITKTQWPPSKASCVREIITNLMASFGVFSRMELIYEVNRLFRCFWM